MVTKIAERATYPATEDRRESRTPPHVSLRVLRKVAGMSLEEVGARIKEHFPDTDVSRGTLSAIETGSRGVSDLMLRALERAYGLDDGSLTTDYVPRGRDGRGAA